MTIPRLLLMLCVTGHSAAQAAVVHAGHGGNYPTIQAAIDAAVPGDTIQVAAGRYEENVVVTKSPLRIEGARAGVTARGRVTGLPDPAVETIIAPPSGSAVVIATAAGPVSLSGLSILAAVPAGDGAVHLETTTAHGLHLLNSHIAVSGGTAGAALHIANSADNALFSGNVFLASAASQATVRLTPGGSLHGVQFVMNDVLRAGTAAGTGLHLEGNRNTGPGNAAPIIRGNEFRGHSVGFSDGGRGLQGALVADNLFADNADGFSGGPAETVFQANSFQSNSRSGLRFTTAGHLSDPDWGSRNCVVEDCDFTGNGTVPAADGYGDVFLEAQSAASLQSNLFRRNRFLSPVAVFISTPAGPVSMARNYWGDAGGPAAARIQGVGSLISVPFYKDPALSVLDFGPDPVSGHVTLTEGDIVECAELNLGAGTQLRAGRGAKVKAGKLTQAPGAVLDVVNGDLSLDPLGAGEYHTLSGSFTFFDCLGSLHINGNTTFGGSTLGISSDIHIAPGVTMLVLGSLILDGCSVTSSGNWNLLIDSGAEFRMFRCSVAGGFISLVGSDASIKDNYFIGTALTAFSTVSGASVFHNILSGGSHLNVLPGSSVVTTVEGWGNVTDDTLVQNALSLDFRPHPDPTRTLDAHGNLYVQPGDVIAVGLDVSRLSVKAQAVETLLGFNTAMLGTPALIPSAIWQNGLYTAEDQTGDIGRFNAAVGLGFTFPDPDGTTQDSPVADFLLTARLTEGETRVFFRQKSAADPAPVDSRITASSAGFSYLLHHPFTRNSAIVTIDGTAPVFHSTFSATQIQNGGAVDVTQVGVITRQGIVTVTVDAADALAGLDDSDASLALSGPSGTVAGVLTAVSPAMHGSTVFTRYTFEIAVTAATPNGVYSIDAAVMDRSGNTGTFSAGALQVQKNQIAVTIQPQGLTAGPLTRNVIFTATDSLGGVLAVWDVPVIFTGGSGSVILQDVPGSIAGLSAKMAWNLRVRLPAALDSNGQAAVAYTGPDRLPGGDLNGDNLINLGDYNLMRFAFPSLALVPDITGDGQTNLADYNILRANWLTAGSAL